MKDSGPEQDTLDQRILKHLKNTRIGALAVVCTVLLGGAAAVLSNLKTIRDFFAPSAPAPSGQVTTIVNEALGRPTPVVAPAPTPQSGPSVEAPKSSALTATVEVEHMGQIGSSKPIRANVMFQNQGQDLFLSRVDLVQVEYLEPSAYGDTRARAMAALKRAEKTALIQSPSQMPDWAERSRLDGTEVILSMASETSLQNGMLSIPNAVPTARSFAFPAMAVEQRPDRGVALGLLFSLVNSAGQPSVVLCPAAFGVNVKPIVGEGTGHVSGPLVVGSLRVVGPGKKQTDCVPKG